MSTKTKEKKSSTLTIAQQAGYARRKLKTRDIDTLRDHRGKAVPIEYVPDMDLVKHFEALDIIEEAERLQQQIAAFKAHVQQRGDELYDQLMNENEIRDQSVGGFTLATFDKELKIIYAMDTVQVKIKEELTVAEGFWEKFLEEEFPEQDHKQHYLSEFVDELLHNTKDQIDLRMLGKLNRMGSKIENKSYHKFLLHLNQAYDTQHTKRYEQFKRRNEQGDYDSILLTYSRINPQNTIAEEQ